MAARGEPRAMSPTWYPNLNGQIGLLQYVRAKPSFSYLSSLRYDSLRLIQGVAIDFALVEIATTAGENKVAVFICPTSINRLDVVYVEIGNEPFFKIGCTGPPAILAGILITLENPL